MLAQQFACLRACRRKQDPIITHPQTVKMPTITPVAIPYHNHQSTVPYVNRSLWRWSALKKALVEQIRRRKNLPFSSSPAVADSSKAPVKSRARYCDFRTNFCFDAPSALVPPGIQQFRPTRTSFKATVARLLSITQSGNADWSTNTTWFALMKFLVCPEVR
jgi:hypothetical protein